MPKNAKALFVIVVLASSLLIGFSGAARGLSEPPVKNQLKSAAYKQKLVKVKQIRQKIDQRRRATWSWQDLSLADHTRSSYREKWSRGIADLNRLLAIWATRHRANQQRAKNPPHLQLWLCIQSGIRGGKWDWLVHRRGGVRVGKGEASWRDDGSPYWGGLQMGQWFHETYGGELYRRLGTANNWQPIQQIWVAERAFAREGYSVRWVLGQWPRTSPPCVSLLE